MYDGLLSSRPVSDNDPLSGDDNAAGGDRHIIPSVRISVDGDD